MTTVTAFRHGKLVFVLLWLAGLGALAGLASGLLPGGRLVALFIVLALGVSIAVGVMCQRTGFFARPITRVDRAPQLLSLTFDDGPDPEFTPRVLDLLRQTGQRATFFVIGAKVTRHPELARRIVEEGHELGNHTMGHPWHLALWPAARIARDLSQASDAIKRATGVRPTLFRAPAALLSPRIESGARRAGLRLVGFSTRSGDGSPLVPVRHALRRLLRGLRPGAILVLHDCAVGGHAPGALEMLPELQRAMEQRQLLSVPLSELLAAAEE